MILFYCDDNMRDSTKSLITIAVILIITISILSIINYFVQNNKKNSNIDNIYINNIKIVKFNDNLYNYSAKITSEIDDNYINYINVKFLDHDNKIKNTLLIYINDILNKNESRDISIDTSGNISKYERIEYKVSHDKNNNIIKDN